MREREEVDALRIDRFIKSHRNKSCCDKEVGGRGDSLHLPLQTAIKQRTRLPCQYTGTVRDTLGTALCVLCGFSAGNIFDSSCIVSAPLNPCV